MIESIGIQTQINNTKTSIIGIYRHPHHNNENASEILKYIDTNYKNAVILGDMNINLLNSQDTKINEYINKLYKHEFLNHIEYPTRITENARTLIDHIYTKGNNLHKLQNKSGILINDISDHYAVFLLIYKAKYENKDRPLIRILSQKNIDKYIKKQRQSKWMIYYCRKPRYKLSKLNK